MIIEPTDFDIKNNLEIKPSTKQHRIQKSLLLTADEQKKKKIKSEIAKWGEDIGRMKLDSTTAITEYIRDKYKKEPSSVTAKILRLIGKTKVSNGKVVFSDNFANKPLTFYVNYYKFPMNFFCNDVLYLIYIYRKIHNKIFNDKDASKTDKIMLEFMSDAVLDKCYYISNTFLLEVGEIYQGFYQDFEEDVAVLGCSDKPNPKDVEAFTNNIVLNGTFKYKNKEYALYTADNKTTTNKFAKSAIFIGPYNKNLNEAKTKISDSMLKFKIYKKENKITEGVKEIKIKSKRVRYLDMKLIPESFCPSFTKLDKDVECCVLYKMKFDLNILFSKLDAYYKSFHSFGFYINSCYWDTMETWFDFLSIYVLTTNSVKGDDLTLLSKIVDTYNSIKYQMKAWKVLQLFLQNLFKSFFNSFNNGINFDVLRNIVDKFELYLTKATKLRADVDEYADFKNFLTRISIFADAMHRQFSDDSVYEVVKRIVYIIKNFLMGEDLGNAARNFRYIGQTIYKMTISFSNVYLFPIVLSPAAFMGDLVGDALPEDPLKALLGDAVLKAEKRELTQRDKIEAALDIQKNIGQYREDVVDVNINNLFSENKWPLTSKNMRYVKLSVIRNLLEDPVLRDKLDELIIKTKLSGTPIKTIVMPKELIENAYKIYSDGVSAKKAFEIINKEWEKLKYMGMDPEKLFLKGDKDALPAIDAPKALPSGPKSGEVRESDEMSESSIKTSTTIPKGLSSTAHPPVRKPVIKESEKVFERPKEVKKKKMKGIIPDFTGIAPEKTTKSVSSIMKSYKEKEKEKGLLLSELKRIKEREKLNEELTKEMMKGDDEDSDSSFIEKDVEYDLSDRTSLLKDITESEIIGPKTKYRNILIADNIGKIIAFYVSLLKLMSKYVPDINGYLMRNINGKTYPKIFSVIGKSIHLSDAFINKLSELNDKIPNMKELQDFFAKNVRARNKYYENLSSLKDREKYWKKDVSVIKDLMNNEYSKWPIYKPPESAVEGFTPGEKAMMEKETKEPKGDDITMMRGSNEFMGD